MFVAGRLLEFWWAPVSDGEYTLDGFIEPLSITGHYEPVNTGVYVKARVYADDELATGYSEFSDPVYVTLL